MTTTPISRSKLCKERTKTDAKKDKDPSSLQSVPTTPSTKNAQLDSDDYSPLYFPSTQETSEEIDVLWDWHSPQSSQRKRKKQKRLIPIQSPKIPVKRLPSNHQSQNFERLKQELKLLQDELAQPDDESCLCVSPQQEQEIKTGESNNLSIETPSQPPNDEFHDMFDDSMDEQLVLFSQTVENKLAEKNNKSLEETQTRSSNLCDTTAINNLINKYTAKPQHSNDTATKNTVDSTFDDFHFAVTQTKKSSPKQSKFVFQRTFSDNSNARSTENVIQTVSGKLEFYRTKSFELAGLNGNCTIPQTTLEEIERKRLQAKAKLEWRKKNAFNKSPTKCSPEEIEKKRLQAQAKLGAKRLQDIVEKKRQEAIKKLQQSRMKNASQVKSSLTTRL